MEEILLGVDPGEKHTGIAFGRAGSVAPLDVIDSKNERYLIAQLAKIAIENKVTKVIIGLPLNSEGKDTNQSLKVRKFVKLLKITMKKPVEFVSEYNSTSEAIHGAIRTGISQKRRKSDDGISAALILKRYYREHEEFTSSSAS